MMFKLTRKIEYALMALHHFELESNKEKPELITAKDQAQIHNIPLEVIAKVLQTLAQQGLLRAKQGAQGGYALAKDLSQINLYELCLMIEKKKFLMRSCSMGPCTHASYCSIKKPVEQFNAKMEIFLKSMSVLDLCVGAQTKMKSNVKNFKALQDKGQELTIGEQVP